MKKYLPFILLIVAARFLFPDPVFAQTIYLDSIAVITDSSSADSVDISLMVSMQIAAALLKQQEESKVESSQIDSLTTIAEGNKTDKDSIIISNVIPAKTEKVNGETQSDTNQSKIEEQSGIDFRIVVLSSAAFLAAGFVSIRRFRINKKSLKGLKQNINLIREEKIVKAADKKLSQLRSKLRKSTEHLGEMEKSVSITAKNLNIAKGELMLAAKIKSFELSQSCSPRQ